LPGFPVHAEVRVRADSHIDAVAVPLRWVRLAWFAIPPPALLSERPLV